MTLILFIGALFVILQLSTLSWAAHVRSSDLLTLTFFEEANFQGETFVAPQGWWNEKCNDLPMFNGRKPLSVDPESICVLVCSDRNCEVDCLKIYDNTEGRDDLALLRLNGEGMSYRGCDYYWNSPQPEWNYNPTHPFFIVSPTEKTDPPRTSTVPPPILFSSPTKTIDPTDPPSATQEEQDSTFMGFWKFLGGSNMLKFINFFSTVVGN